MSEVVRVTAQVQSVPDDRPAPPTILGKAIVYGTRWNGVIWERCTFVSDDEKDTAEWIQHFRDSHYTNITVIEVPAGGGA